MDIGRTPLGKIRNLSKDWGKIQQMHAAFNLEQLCSIHVISNSSVELVRQTFGKSCVCTILVPLWFAAQSQKPLLTLLADGFILH